MAKSARIKDFKIEQLLKTGGIEIQVDEKGKQFGDIYVAKTGVTWCNKGDWRKNGIRFSFDELDLLATYKTVALAAVKKAKKDAQKNKEKVV